jgi:hypothetical protein
MELLAITVFHQGVFEAAHILNRGAEGCDKLVDFDLTHRKERCSPREEDIAAGHTLGVYFRDCTTPVALLFHFLGLAYLRGVSHVDRAAAFVLAATTPSAPERWP